MACSISPLGTLSLSTRNHESLKGDKDKRRLDTNVGRVLLLEEPSTLLTLKSIVAKSDPIAYNVTFAGTSTAVNTNPLQEDALRSGITCRFNVQSVQCAPSVGILMPDAPFDISTLMRWRALKGYSLSGVGKPETLVNTVLYPSLLWKRGVYRLRNLTSDEILQDHRNSWQISAITHPDYSSGSFAYDSTLLLLDQYDKVDVVLLDLERQLDKEADIEAKKSLEVRKAGGDDIAAISTPSLNDNYARYRYRAIKHTNTKVFSAWKWLIKYYPQLVGDFNENGRKKVQLTAQLEQVKQSIQNVSVSHGGTISGRIKQQYNQLMEEQRSLEEQLKPFRDAPNGNQKESFSTSLGGGVLAILQQMRDDPKIVTNQESEFKLVSAGKRASVSDIQGPTSTISKDHVDRMVSSPSVVTAIDTIVSGGVMGSSGIGTPITSDNAPKMSPKVTSVNVLTSPIPQGMVRDFRVYSNSYRMRALALCGWVSRDGCWTTEEELQELESKGHCEIAAGFAIFRGCDFIRAINSLLSSEDEKLKLAATALAGLSALSQTILRPDDSSKNNVKYWQDMCQSLSNTIRDPYLSAIFVLFASGGDWGAVFKVSSLPIKERVAIALRFLPDDELVHHIRNIARTAILEGDLGGLVLTGLSPQAIDLMQAFVDRTGDVQTASLLCSTFVPLVFSDSRVDAWISSYRELLDKWQLFDIRCDFDVELGRLISGAQDATCVLNISERSANERTQSIKLLSEVMQKSSQNGDVDASTQAAKVLAEVMSRENEEPLPESDDTPSGANTSLPFFKMVVGGHVQRPQLVMRCMYCKQPVVQLETQNASSREGISGAKVADTAQLTRLRCCANCRKLLPRCSLCLMQLGHDMGGAWVTWCQSCGHGGHTDHLEAWFAQHTDCPVAMCRCNCASI